MANMARKANRKKPAASNRAVRRGASRKRLVRLDVMVPESISREVASRVAEGGFTDAGDYIRALVDEHTQMRNRINELLLEGIASGSGTPLSELDWDRLFDSARESAARSRRRSA